MEIMMTKRSYMIIFCWCMMSTLILISTGWAFIEREYTLQEVLDTCSNVVFGTVESVDRGRMLATATVEENLKGTSEFNRIKMNIAVGQVRGELTSPNMMIKKFKPGLPIIFLYEKQGARIAALGYVAGTWFQLFATDNPTNRDKVWWAFTHIEAYMPRTYDGSTEDFQRLLRDAMAGKKWPGAKSDTVKVLALTANSTQPILGQVQPNSQEAARLVGTPEFLALSKFTKVDGRTVAYRATKDRRLPSLEEAHILWIGQGEISENRYLLPKNTEEKIKRFVQRGGIVIVTGQDSDANSPCDTGWIPEPMVGVERTLQTDFRPTKQAGNLFAKPNTVKPGQINIDDTWTQWSKKYTVLATTNNGQDIVVATLKYGKGMYIVTGIHNETPENVRANAPLMENLIYYAVKKLVIGKT